MYKIKIVLITLLCFPLLGKAENIPASPPRDLSIYLLMGQSNMSGRGDLAQLPSALNLPQGNLWLYGNDGKWRLAIEPLDDATDQIDEISSDAKKAGVGPGLFFAKSLLKSKKARIGLVPCAKGGSSLSQWKPNADRTRLYGSCLARAQEAASQGRIAGVLWYQGETDAEKMETAELWSERMIALVESLRSDIGQQCLPWVIVGLADRPDPLKWPRPTEAWGNLQLAQKELPKKIVRVGYVSAAGLDRNSDDIHLTTEAQSKLGPRLAAKMRRLQKTSCK